MAEKLKVGIVGIGRIGGNHASEIGGMPDKFELVACADNDPERLTKDLPEQLKNTAKYNSLEEMLRHPGLDMVTIAVRHPDHVPMAIKILEAGKIAVVEKPVATSVAEMEKMLDGYLAFVSGEGGEKNTFIDMNELILSIINKFRNTKAMIRYSTNDQVSAIQGREQALKRAVTNIISNAFAYGKNIAVGLESNNNKLEITVDDDGPGIPADKREDVFKAFYRLDESRNKETGGVGLGLSIARDIITSHGGKIELTDSELGGLRVLISIPL